MLEAHAEDGGVDGEDADPREYRQTGEGPKLVAMTAPEPGFEGQFSALDDMAMIEEMVVVVLVPDEVEAMKDSYPYCINENACDRQ